MTQRAFSLRMKIDRKDRVPQGLDEDRIMIGWSHAKGLIDAPNQRAVRHALQEAYDDLKDNNHRAGWAAAELWRFLGDMSEKDLVIVPHRGSNFYVAEVKGPARFDADRVATDTAHFRPVRWLNARQPFSRGVARSNLRNMLMGRHVRYVCRDATHALEEIHEVIRDYSGQRGADAAQKPPLGLFREDLATRTLAELRTGKMDERVFEKLLERLFVRLGGKVEMPGRRADKGADLVVVMSLGRSFLTQRVAIQAKYHPHPNQVVPEKAVDQLIAGMDEENADLGLVITANDHFHQSAIDLAEQCDKKIEFINGPDLARMLVEHGL